MEVDWNVFERHIEKAIELVPIFQKAGIKTTVCGAEAFTPDHKPLIGMLSTEVVFRWLENVSYSLP